MTFVPKRSVGELQILGLGFRFLERQNHVGLLVKYQGGVRMCHLRWHHDLVFELASEDYFWDECPFPRELALAVAGYATAIGTAHPTVPFGISYPGGEFSSQGEFINVPKGHGLTCATFVMSVFHHLGLALFDLSSWKRRPGDELWQKKIVKKLEADGHQEHANKLRSDVGARRYRPEEVAVAAVSSSLPLTFDQAILRGKELIKAVRSSVRHA